MCSTWGLGELDAGCPPGGTSGAVDSGMVAVSVKTPTASGVHLTLSIFFSF